MRRSPGSRPTSRPTTARSRCQCTGDFRHDNMIFGLDATGLPGPQGAPAQALGPGRPAIGRPHAPRARPDRLGALHAGPWPLADLAYQVAQWRLPAQGAFFQGARRPRPSGAGHSPARRPMSRPTCAGAVSPTCRTGASRWCSRCFGSRPFLEGVYRRALDGNASNRESGLLMGETVPVLARSRRRGDSPADERGVRGCLTRGREPGGHLPGRPSCRGGHVPGGGARLL